MYRAQVVVVSTRVSSLAPSRTVLVLRVVLSGVPSVLDAVIPVVILGESYYMHIMCANSITMAPTMYSKDAMLSNHFPFLYLYPQTKNIL